MDSTVPPLASKLDDKHAQETIGSAIQTELLDSPQRAILEKMQGPTSDDAATMEPQSIQQRLQTLANNLEFSVDQFAHGIHALATTQATGEKLAERTLAEAADVLTARDQERRQQGKGADAMNALKALSFWFISDDKTSSMIKMLQYYPIRRKYHLLGIKQ